MAPMSDCIFCVIAAGSVAAEIVLESEHIVAFLDTRPCLLYTSRCV